MGLELTDYDAVFPHLDNVGTVHDPFNGVLVLGIHTLEIAKGFRSVQGRGILTPLTAKADRIKGEFCVGVLLHTFKVFKQGAQGVIRKLRLAPASAEGFDE